MRCRFLTTKELHEEMAARIKKAKERVSMAYMCMDSGPSLRPIIEAIKTSKANIRIMVDYFGQRFDHPANISANIGVIRELREHGAEVLEFRSRHHPLWDMNILHAKFCAVDDGLVFIGGANLGEFYQDWHDTNLAVEGPLGENFHRVFDFFKGFCTRGAAPDLKLGETENLRVLVNAPGHLAQISDSIMEHFRNSDSLFIKSWNFYPPKSVISILEKNLERGRKVTVNTSERCRYPHINLLNRQMLERLREMGATVKLMKGTYMHSKVYWNGSGDIIVGSANLSKMELGRGFELSVQIKDKKLSRTISS